MKRISFTIFSVLLLVTAFAEENCQCKVKFTLRRNCRIYNLEQCELCSINQCKYYFTRHAISHCRQLLCTPGRNNPNVVEVATTGPPQKLQTSSPTPGSVIAEAEAISEPADIAELDDDTYAEPVAIAELDEDTYAEPAVIAELDDDTYAEPAEIAELDEDTYAEPAAIAELDEDTYAEPAEIAELDDDTYAEPADIGEYDQAHTDAEAVKTVKATAIAADHIAKHKNTHIFEWYQISLLAIIVSFSFWHFYHEKVIRN